MAIGAWLLAPCLAPPPHHTSTPPPHHPTTTRAQGIGLGAFSEPVYLRTDNDVPDALTLIDFLDGSRTDTSLTVEWRKPQDNGMLITAY